MFGFSKKDLKKLKKDDLIVIIQEQDVKRERHEEHMGNFDEGIRKLTSSFANLKPELTISKNITISTNLLSEKLAQMEGQC